MSGEAIDGTKYAELLKMEVRAQMESLGADGLDAHLAVVRVGEDYRAKSYEQRLRRAGGQLGLQVSSFVLDERCTQAELLDRIRALNHDPEVSAILLLRPLPPQLTEVEAFRALSPLKDVEAVHPENAGLLALGCPRYLPSTPAAAFYILDHWLDDHGLDRAQFYRSSLIVVVGRSNNVGKPAVSMAFERQAAVESIDEWASVNGRLGWFTRRADVLIVAAGQPGLIRTEHVRSGAIVLDVGINPVTHPVTGEVRLVGDVVYDAVATRAGAITPVPGGVGPVTDIWLMKNCALAARNLARDQAVPDLIDASTTKFSV